jgi:hypothetical protein
VAGNFGGRSILPVRLRVRAGAAGVSDPLDSEVEKMFREKESKKTYPNHSLIGCEWTFSEWYPFQCLWSQYSSLFPTWRCRTIAITLRLDMILAFFIPVGGEIIEGVKLGAIAV